MAKKILKRISLICIALLVGVGAFLLPTLNFKSNTYKLSYVAHADVITSDYTFEGSNLWFPTEVLNYGANTGETSDYPWAGVVWSNFNIIVSSYNSSINYLGLNVRSITWNSAFSLNYNEAVAGVPQFLTYRNVTQDIQDIDLEIIPGNWVRFYLKSNDWSNVSANFIRVEIGQNLYEWGSLITYCRYYDSNSNYIEVSCVTLSDYERTSSGSLSFDEVEALTIPTRSYLLSNVLSENDIYQQGFLDGESKGFADGEYRGFIDGYSRGHEEGKNEGYYEGLEQNNPYTFDALISSVLDVPVRTFTSLFHFNILGVQLDEFMLGLFTFCIIITLVRWCL